jgi:DNA helicase IV
MRRAAERISAGYAEVGEGGTHAARLEREVAEATTRRRLAALDIRDQPLCFGRIDLERDPSTEVGSRYYIGRLSVTDADQTPLVVDWRAPVAEPFYRATAVEPMGLVRRRHFQTKGRQLLGLDDEVFDDDASRTAGLTISGEGALLAAIERHRTGRMSDIVATIQREQDEAIRAPLPGILCVSGGAGTGKTAVALHRAAYLLYTHRRQLASRGMLLVGPNPIFLHYIDEVLPSLGEDDVHLTTIAALKPAVAVHGTEDAELAVIKGDARMATVMKRALADRERALRRDLAFTLDGYRITLTASESTDLLRRVRRAPGTHNARRPLLNRLVVDHLRRRYRRALVDAYRRGTVTGEATDVEAAGALARGEELPEDWDDDLGARLRARIEVREALERMWPVLTGPELVHDLFSFEALIHSAADGVLSAEEQRRLFRARSPHLRDVAWTDADLAIIDEADALLGPPEAARPRRRRRRARDESVATAARVLSDLGLSGTMTPETLASRYGGAASAEPSPLEPRTFGHVLVDEAQDLSAMEWRMLARRCPSGSMTLVGDFGQARGTVPLTGWDAVTRHLPTHNGVRVADLTVSYRTPAEILEVANRLLAVGAPDVAPARAVRQTGTRPEFDEQPADSLVAAAVAHVRRLHGRGGTVALIAPDAFHGDLVVSLADMGAVSDTIEALDAPVAVLTPLTVKGLEFDHVVVVEPARLVGSDSAGLRLLYVSLTRATQDLVVVHAEPLPEALVPAPVAHAAS